MGEVVVSDRIALACSSADAFTAIASGGAPHWRLPLGRDLQVGVPVRIPLQLPDRLGGTEVEVLGRVRRVEWPHLIVIEHVLPWRGTITVKVRPDGADRCVVTIVGRVQEDLVAWATRFATAVPEPARSDRDRIGLISSGTGAASVFSVAAIDMARLAVEELNLAGGVLGRQLELVVGDDGTHPGLGAAELVRLAHAGCRIVLANVTSATFRALQPVARRYGVLLVHTPMNEGGACSTEVFRLGERPRAQVSAAIPAIMQATGGKRFYLAGNDYSWPRATVRAARGVIERSGGCVAATQYLPLGSSDFGEVIEAVDRSGAELVVSTFVGADEVAFEQQMHAAGLRAKVQTLSFALDESTHEYIGPEASAGLWAAFGYFQTLSATQNVSFLLRYRERFGEAAPPVSSLSECVYEGMHLVGRAAAQCGELEPGVVGRQLRDGVAYHGPRGRVTASWRGVRQPMYLARSQGGQLQAIEQVDARPA